jgi:hypothetical protein
METAALLAAALGVYLFLRKKRQADLAKLHQHSPLAVCRSNSRLFLPRLRYGLTAFSMIVVLAFSTFWIGGVIVLREGPLSYRWQTGVQPDPSFNPAKDFNTYASGLSAEWHSAILHAQSLEEVRRIRAVAHEREAATRRIKEAGLTGYMAVALSWSVDLGIGVVFVALLIRFLPKKRIDLSCPQTRRDWCIRFGVSDEVLVAGAQEAGSNRAVDIARALLRNPHSHAS